jgi:hypothetical protein
MTQKDNLLNKDQLRLLRQLLEDDKQTSVERLIFELISNCKFEVDDEISDMFKIALEMEKEQIEDAFYYGVELTKVRLDNIIDASDYEEYYNDKYK